LASERIIEEIAYALGEDPLEIRTRNLYGGNGRNVTPYHQTVEDNIAARLIAELGEASEYARRRQEILAFNRGSRVIRRGIALVPVKFGVSFTLTAYVLAGALFHISKDGS